MFRKQKFKSFSTKIYLSIHLPDIIFFRDKSMLLCVPYSHWKYLILWYNPPVWVKEVKEYKNIYPSLLEVSGIYYKFSYYCNLHAFQLIKQSTYWSRMNQVSDLRSEIKKSLIKEIQVPSCYKKILGLAVKVKVEASRSKSLDVPKTSDS